MTSKKAIRILTNQKSYLNDSYLVNDILYLAQTKIYIEEIFGKDSEYYELVDSFKFGQDKDYENSERMKEIFDSCILTINNVGIKRKEWKHVLITTNPGLFWTIFAALLGFAFWLGGEVATNKSNQTPNQIPVYKNDSIKQNRP